jgi:hypothetical protein
MVLELENNIFTALQPVALVKSFVTFQALLH